MKLLRNKNLIQKLIIAIVCITLLNFCMAPKVQADFGGKMMSYIRDFATALGDVAISLVQFGVTGNWTYAVDEKGSGEVQGVNGKRSDYWIKDSKFEYPIIQLSPELIFGDKVELLGIDFIGGDNGAEGDDKYILKTDGSAIESLRVIIASWYVTLRTIAIVGLLSVLIYIGIRIIISSTSQDRAKYKQRLVDWIVAFCLLFFMHYIMAAAVNVIGQVNDILGKNIISGIKLSPEYGNVKYNPVVSVEDSDDMINSDNDSPETRANLVGDFLRQVLGDTYAGMSEVGTTPLGGHTWKYTDKNGGTIVTIERQALDSGIFNWVISGWDNSLLTNDQKERIKTIVYDGRFESNDYSKPVEGNDNLSQIQSARKYTVNVSPESLTDGSKILYYINYARLYLNVSTKDQYIAVSVGYLILYLILVVFTIMFTVRYMKRVIYVAFLTLIAPMVAMTYPLDKIKDRKSTSL